MSDDVMTDETKRRRRDDSVGFIRAARRLTSLSKAHVVHHFDGHHRARTRVAGYPGFNSASTSRE